MQAIQMEFNVQEKTDLEIQLWLMQQQINALKESTSKVRKNLFAQMCELNKLYISVKNENERLKQEMKKSRNEKTDWIYFKDDFLFMDKCG